jgi:serine/threonine protein kinase
MGGKGGVMTTGELRAGDVLRDGRYEIQRLLRPAAGKRVYLALDRTFDCQVALDIFSDNNAAMPGGLTVSAWEARVLGQLGSHPNIARVQDYWEENGTAAMATRYLSGGTLRDLIAQSREAGVPLPTERVLRIAAQIARGLEHIHGRRILYRDLQPRNVLFDEWDTVHLVDFDTAVVLDDPDVNGLSRRPVIDYMAPEMIAGSPADERADLYSLGATMHEMITGHPPFTGTREQVLAAHCRGSRPLFDRDDVTDTLRDLVLSLLAPGREQRPASAAEVADRIEQIAASHAEIEQLLKSDESATLEFKSTLRTPVGPRQPGDTRTDLQLRPVLEFAVLRTLAAFQNTDGGTLIIGVSDGRRPIGIEADYPRVRGSRDGWRLTFDNLVSTHLGKDAMSCISLELQPWNGRTIAIIRCSPRQKEPTWIGDELWVRRTASTQKLSIKEAVAWCRERWG